VGDAHQTRPDDALIEPLFAGLLEGEHGSVAEPAPSRPRSARRAWIGWGLALVAALIAIALAR
jgi:hypothetical protein